jgi:hypothetical protein
LLSACGLVNPQLALFAAIGSFGTLAMAISWDRIDRARAYLVLTLLGCA